MSATVAASKTRTFSMSKPPRPPRSEGARRPPKTSATNASREALGCESEAAARPLAAQRSGRVDGSEEDAQGFAETGITFVSADPESRFAESIRLQRLFATLDDDESRRALLHMAETLAAAKRG